MNREGWGLGRACQTLKRRRGAEGSSEEGIERRFRAALASETPEALAVHLRGLVTLLRSADVPLDYARLYRDLCSWPYPDRRERVCLSWARDYFVTRPHEDEEDDR
jgi:CRISPR system Cascade subunit CasB